MDDKMQKYLDSLINEDIIYRANSPQEDKGITIYGIKNLTSTGIKLIYNQPAQCFRIIDPNVQGCHFSFNYYGILPRIIFKSWLSKDVNIFIKKYIGKKTKLLKRKSLFIKK